MGGGEPGDEANISLLNLFLIFSVKGTHDIQNVMVSSFNSEVRVTGDFIDGSTATGLLILIYSLTDDSDTYYIYKNYEQNVVASVTGLTGSHYGVSVFVVEKNGLPFSRVAAIPSLVENSAQQGLYVVPIVLMYTCRGSFVS